MKKGIFITLGVVTAAGVAYVVYKKMTPPRFTVRDFSPVTMDGNFEWGKASGPLNNSSATFVAGWGWEGKMITDQTKKQFRLDVSKNGRPYTSIIIDSAGNYNL